MNQEDPLAAQQIVAGYVRVLDRDLQRGRFPLPVDSLPFAKPTIKAAIETSLLALASTGQLTQELREFLETAYVRLADYVAADLVRLMTEYARAGEELAADLRLAREKTTGPAWKTVTESGRLAGDIARAIADEADSLRGEFERLVTEAALAG